MTKKSILLIFKDKKKITKNHEFWIDKFSKEYSVNDFYLYDYLNCTNKKIIEKINDLIITKNIETALIEGDHLALNDYLFINSINKKIKKGLFLGDDPEWHQVNLITAFACDFVLTDSISALKFKEMGIQSIFCPVETNEEIFKNYNQNKDIDVLIFGRNKPETQEYLDLLDQNNIKYLSVDPYMEVSNTIEKLAKLISKSKIVINLTKTLNGKKFFNPLTKFKYGFFPKGRVYMTGLCYTLCLSEYAPSNELLFPKGEIPSFKSKDQFIDKLKMYLNDEKKLNYDTKIFYESCLKYSDKEYIKVLKKFIDNVVIIKNKKNIKIPLWYYFISIKQYFRLRSKFGRKAAFLKQFFENFSLPFYLIPINLFFFIRFLPNFIMNNIFKRKHD